MKRHICSVCGGRFRGRDGSGWMLWWKCHRCRSQIATEERTSELPPAGWLDDPDNPTRERWWDGNDWTHHTR